MQRLYGNEEYEFIRTAHVAVVGIGGVGSWAAEAIVRSGVGTITLIDMDKICITNTNRQIHTLDHTIGQPKVEVLAARIKAINPECQVIPVFHMFSKETLDFLPDDLNYVIDAIDSVKHKAAMINHCSRKKIPIICAGAAAGQTDPTAITIKDLNRAHNDPLLAKVRSFLRRYYGFSKNPKRRFGIRCVFSTEQLNYPQEDGTVCKKRSPERAAVRLEQKGGLGASMCVTATFGLVASSFILKKIIEKGMRKKG